MSDYRNLQAVELFGLSLPDSANILEVGGGNGAAAEYLRNSGFNVFDLDYAKTGERFESANIPGIYDGLYCSHTLEHVRNVGVFLDKARKSVVPGGVLCFLVPPAKHNIVGGHLSLWNSGLLIYNLIRAHIDCKTARVREYGYNCAVLVRNNYAEYRDDELNEDNGDIEALAEFFPFPVSQGFDGRIFSHNWRPLHPNKLGGPK